jgi:Holliday junction resolvasome RuvABC endonuclease subunit
VASLRILGIDPGTVFSGYCIIDVCGTKIKIVRSGLFRNLVKTVDANTYASTKAYMKEIRFLLNTYKPDIVNMESFTVRKFQTNLGAPISLMIGAVLHMCHKRNIKFLTTMPSDWKNKLKRDFKNVEDLYDLSYPVKDRLPNHNIDSFFQALFASGDKCYKNLNQTQVDNIKKKLINSTSRQDDTKFVNDRIKEEMKAKKLKKSKKRKKKK